MTENDGDKLKFGVDSLSTPSKITKIYLNTKASLYSDDDYFESNYKATAFDDRLIDDFREREGNKRKAVTALLCSGYSYLFSELGTIVDDNFAYRLNKLIMRLYAYADKMPFPFWKKLKFETNDFNVSKYYEVIRVYFPAELHSMLSQISFASGIDLSTIIIFTMRIGALHYNEFIKRFSTNFFELDDEIEEICQKTDDMFANKLLLSIEFNINVMEMLRNTYADVLRDKMKDDIDKFISEWREKNGK